jgi:hypothetical protein
MATMIAGQHKGGSYNQLEVRLAQVGLLLDEITSDLELHRMSESDAFLLEPHWRQIEIALDRLRSQMAEAEAHGCSYPQGKPRLRLAGDSDIPCRRELADAA